MLRGALVALVLCSSSLLSAAIPSASLPQPRVPVSAWQTTRTANNDAMLRATTKIKAVKNAQLVGCGKTEGVILQPGQLPNETALHTPGTVYFKEANGTITSQTDHCAIDPVTGLFQLQEFWCMPWKASGGLIQQNKFFPCATGSTCLESANGGACVPQSWNGCYLGQAPLLDSDHNGTPDACFCGPGTFPTDTNGDGNSDSCTFVSKGGTGVCEKYALQATKKKADVQKKGSGVESGGWTLYDYCSNPFALTHVICSTTEVLNTSSTICGPKKICDKGNCVDAGGDVCDGTNVPFDKKTGLPDAYKKGFVLVNSVPTAWDTCNADDTKVVNVFCYCPTCAVSTYESPCKTTEKCSDALGICVPKENPKDDKDGDGVPDGKDPDSDGDGTPDAQDPVNCVPEIKNECKEISDGTHPIDPVTGMQLYGDPDLFGETQTGVTIKGCADIPFVPSFTAPDSCAWEETLLLPELTQSGCVDNFLVSSEGPCDWSKKKACDWQAKTAKERGVCKTVNGPAKPTFTAATAATPAAVGGTNAFGHAIKHQDICIPSLGMMKVKRWKAADNPEGVIAYEDVCPAEHHCENGLCTPDPCFGKKYDDNNSCTDDICDKGTGLSYFIPIPIDDDNFCTVDACADVGGKPEVTHTPITGGNCSGWTYCQEHPDDASCKPSGGVDCAKNPTDPSCPPTGGFDCAVCDNATYAANHPECAQCADTQKFCIDDDIANVPETKGTTVLFPGIIGKESSAVDACWGWSETLKQFTTVLQSDCGPNNTFHFSPFVCPKDGKGCVDGVCVAK